MILALAVPAGAVSTWDLVPPPSGTIGTTQGYTSTPDGKAGTAAGFAFNGGSAGGPLPLNAAADGLGIVGGGLLGCGTTQIDQCAPAEFLRFEFPTSAWDPVSVTLTNLELLSGDHDNWLIYGDNDGDLLNGATLLASGDETGAVGGKLTILLPGTTPFQYLYIRPAVESDCTTTLNCGGLITPNENDEFRVVQIQGETGEVPEPATLLLLGTGLVGLGVLARRRRTVK